MTSRSLVVVGAGGFGREVLDVVSAINEAAAVSQWDVLGVYDDSPSSINIERLENRGIRSLGPVPKVWQGRKPYFVVGVGNPIVRKKITEQLESFGWTSAILVHPSAVIGSRTVIEPGTIVCGGVQVSTNVRCGKHVHLNPNATIGHDTVLSDFVSVNPAATISGEVHVSDCVLIGAGSVILQGLNVEERSTVGAGACVVRDVPSAVTVKGIPAK